MRRTGFGIACNLGRAVTVALFCAACAVRSGPVSTEREVIAAQQALITANNAADVAVVELLTADEWVGIEASGIARTKAQLRESIGARGAAAVQATPAQLAVRQQEWRVRLYNGVAILTRVTAGDHGSRAWVTTTWIRRDGRWQRVHSQVTTAALTETMPPRLPR